MEEKKPLLQASAGPPAKKEQPENKCSAYIRALAGVKLAKDGKSVFNYNPEKLQRGPFWALVWWFMPGIFNKWWWWQLFFLVALAHLWAYKGSDTKLTEECWGSGQMMNPESTGILDFFVETYYEQLASLTRFVLGLYVSLALARTYYANRREFGVLFGRTMGFCQMVAAWVQPPDNKLSCDVNAIHARDYLVRWVNAAFRLMVLEVRDKDAREIGDCMQETGLLTKEEWEHIANIPSRATHIYQWINNVLYDLLRAGYIKDTILLNRMHTQIDDMRAANVWGLPSLPIVYVQLVTTMVKLCLICLAIKEGASLKRCQMMFEAGQPYIGMLAMTYCQIVLEHFLYQGMLDLHGALYNPNGGLYLGHLPADNFLDFVQTVTTNVVHKNQKDKLPYKLKL